MNFNLHGYPYTIGDLAWVIGNDLTIRKGSCKSVDSVIDGQKVYELLMDDNNSIEIYHLSELYALPSHAEIAKSLRVTPTPTITPSPSPGPSHTPKSTTTPTMTPTVSSVIPVNLLDTANAIWYADNGNIEVLSNDTIKLITNHKNGHNASFKSAINISNNTSFLLSFDYGQGSCRNIGIVITSDDPVILGNKKIHDSEIYSSKISDSGSIEIPFTSITSTTIHVEVTLYSDSNYKKEAPDKSFFMLSKLSMPYRSFGPPTPTPTHTITPSPSPTLSITPSITPSISISKTPSPTNTPTATMTVTPSVTKSLIVTLTPSVTPSTTVTSTITSTPIPTITPSITVSASLTLTPLPSITPSISQTISITPSITPTNTLTPTTTISLTPSISQTISITPSISASITPSISQTISITPSITPTITPTNTLTPTTTISLTPSISQTPVVTNTPTPTIAPSITPTLSLTPSITPSITPTVSLTPTGPSIGQPLLGNHAMVKQSDSGGSSPAMTTAIDTQPTGSAFFAMIGGWAYTNLPTDNKGNTYSKLGTFRDFGGKWANEGLQAFVSYGSGGTGHVLSLVKDSQWTNNELTMPFVEIKGSDQCIVSQGYYSTVGTTASQSITTTGPALIIAVWNGDGGQHPSNMTAIADNNFTVIESYLNVPSDSSDQMCVAAKQVNAAGTYTVNWTYSPTQGADLSLFAFQSSTSNVTYATWSPTRKGSGVVLSNNNLTSTIPALNAIAASVNVDAATAHLYWEAHVDVVDSGKFMEAIGLMTSTDTDFAHNIGVQRPSLGWSNNGSYDQDLSGSTSTETSDKPVYTSGDTLMAALILGKFYIGKNGVWTGDPNAGTGAITSGITGSWTPAASSYDSPNAKVTVNFGASTWKYIPPTGCSGLIQSGAVTQTQTLTVTGNAPSAMTVGDIASGSYSASGGTPPYTYTITSGALPTGESLSSSGVRSGTVTTAGAYNYQVTATDSLHATGYINESVVVSAAGGVTGLTVRNSVSIGGAATNKNTTTAITTQSTGSSYLIAVAAGGSGTITVTDSKSNVYTAIQPTISSPTTNIGAAAITAVFLCSNGVGGSGHTFAATRSGGYPSVFVLEIAGNAVLDGTVAHSGDTTSPYSSGSVTTSVANDLLVSFLGTAGSTATVTATAGNGFTKVQEVSSDQFWTGVMGTLIAPTTGTYSDSWTFNQVVDAGATLIALKPA